MEWLFVAGTLYTLPFFLLVRHTHAKSPRRRVAHVHACQHRAGSHASSFRRTLGAAHNPAPLPAEGSNAVLLTSVRSVIRAHECYQMVIAPNWRGTQRLLRPDSIFVPLALMYGVLLVRSWAPDTLALMMPGSLREGFTGACRLRTAVSDHRASPITSLGPCTGDICQPHICQPQYS